MDVHVDCVSLFCAWLIPRHGPPPLSHPSCCGPLRWWALLLAAAALDRRRVHRGVGRGPGALGAGARAGGEGSGAAGEARATWTVDVFEAHGRPLNREVPSGAQCVVPLNRVEAAF